MYFFDLKVDGPIKGRGGELISRGLKRKFMIATL